MIKVYTRDGCSYCDKAKAILENFNTRYEEIKIGVDITRDKVVEMFPDRKVLPIITDDDYCIGHSDDLVPYLAKLADISKLKYNLSSRVCQVTFTKSNGEQRVMNCTTAANIVPSEKHPTNKRTVLNENVVRAFDVDINEWRSFNKHSVISWQ